MRLQSRHSGKEAIQEMLYSVRNEKTPAFKFLVTNETIPHRINQNENIVIKKARLFRMHHLVSGVFLVVVGIIICLKPVQHSYIIVGLLTVIWGIYMALPFFNNKEIVVISTDGLLVNETIFTPWTDIEYLYFEMVDNEDGYTYCLVNCLKDGYEHKIDLRGTDLSTEKLGAILHAYMKKFSN